MTADNCLLCGKYSDLKKSHLMPKGLYKIVSQTYCPYDSAPVWASQSDKSVLCSNYQITKRLLCSVCEDRFNKHGEKYIMQNCLKNARTFNLKKNLDSASPSIHVRGSSYFNPKDVPALNTDKYMYFVASIVWRVTATDWGNDDITYLHGSLPAELKESIQLYLLNKKEFPKNVYITVCVDSDVEPVPMMTLPSGEIEKNMHMSFYIPGVKFNIFFGDKADPDLSYQLSKLGINLVYMYRSFRGSEDYRQMVNLLKYELSLKGKRANNLVGE